MNAEGKSIYTHAEERDTFEAFLRSRGLRLTKQRKLIFDEVFSLDGHLDADRIASKLKDAHKNASRATVYRTLDLLAEAGLAKRVRLTANNMVYEPIRTGEHHDHMVCLRCGKIIEFF